jgi:hypothetical protein
MSVKEVNKIIENKLKSYTEVKEVTVRSTQSIYYTNPFILKMSDVSQGDTGSTRTGEQISPESLKLS